MATKTLPAATVPEKGYDLVSDFAHANKMSISEALRYICQNSDELKQFAKADDLSSYFQMGTWGGYRERNDDGESE